MTPHSKFAKDREKILKNQPCQQLVAFHVHLCSGGEIKSMLFTCLHTCEVGKWVEEHPKMHYKAVLALLAAGCELASFFFSRSECYLRPFSTL